MIDWTLIASVFMSGFGCGMLAWYWVLKKREPKRKPAIESDGLTITLSADTTQFTIAIDDAMRQLKALEQVASKVSAMGVTLEKTADA